MEKTPQELQALKDNWLDDPIWEIERTEGFEEYASELKAFREEWEAKWKADQEEGIKLTFKFQAQQILAALEPLDGETVDWTLAVQQVKATLLLAEQVKRVADGLDDLITRDEQDFMTALYNIK